MASLLSAREVPPKGGERRLGACAWATSGSRDAKPHLHGRVAIDSFVYSRGLVGDDLFAPTTRRRCRPFPRPSSGRILQREEAFYVGSHAAKIVGMPTEEARALLDDLLVAATIRKSSTRTAGCRATS